VFWMFVSPKYLSWNPDIPLPPESDSIRKQGLLGGDWGMMAKS
jgi:hypothetical protein